MTNKTLHAILIYFIAAVWIANGLFCKVLNLVPRHQEIVARILGEEYSGILVKVIGVSEILMAVWILSKVKSRLNASAQIIIILTMNIIEFAIASDLLLWGKTNIIFALLFIVVIFYNEFVLNKKLNQQT
ncbi:MAG: DoxX-like family protein [Bacteroidetes bacterium]|nr:DoxX-like family protein [Bacteroidota bacterium]